MFLKRLFFITAIILEITSAPAYAGGPERFFGILCPPPVFNSFVYVSIAAGYGLSDWTNLIQESGLAANGSNGGLAYGIKIGYQAIPYLGFEAGMYGLPREDQKLKNHHENIFSNETDSTTSWIMYAAGTIRSYIPEHERFSIYGKIGPVFRGIGHHGNSIYGHKHMDSPSGNYWSVIFGTGIDYNFTYTFLYQLPVSIGAEYLFVPPNDSFLASFSSFREFKVNQDAAPAAHIFIANVSVQFPV